MKRLWGRLRFAPRGGGTVAPPINETPWPNAQVPGNAARVVMAHWHAHPTRYGTTSTQVVTGGYPDYYADFLINPATSEGGAHAAYGGYIRDRPLYRGPRTDTIYEARVADAEEECRLARDAGVDCFIMNYPVTRVALESATGIQLLQHALYQAAENVGFKVAAGIDMQIVSSYTAQNMADYISMWVSRSCVQVHPVDGRPILVIFRPDATASPDLPTPTHALRAAWWASVKALVPGGVHLVGTFNASWGVAAVSTYLDVMDSVSLWQGTYMPEITNPGGMVNQFYEGLAARGQPFVPCTFPQAFYTANGHQYWNADGPRMFRTAWDWVQTKSDISLVQVTTWNDYSEHHHVRPSSYTQYAFYDLLRWYASRWKGGGAPPVTKDVLLYFYKVQSSDNAAANFNPALQTVGAYSHMGGAPALTNRFHLEAFLMAPATLQIDATTVDVPAGQQRMDIAWVGAGHQPVFSIKRGGSTVATVIGAFPTVSSATYENYLYHGGGSSRPPVVYPPA